MSYNDDEYEERQFPLQNPPGGGYPSGGHTTGYPGGAGGVPQPTSPPPSYTPQQNQGLSSQAVSPSSLRMCLYRWTYIWLERTAILDLAFYAPFHTIAIIRITATSSAEQTHGELPPSFAGPIKEKNIAGAFRQMPPRLVIPVLKAAYIYGMKSRHSGGIT
jgi:hypothetical protein